VVDVDPDAFCHASRLMVNHYHLRLETPAHVGDLHMESHYPWREEGRQVRSGRSGAAGVSDEM